MDVAGVNYTAWCKWDCDSSGGHAWVGSNLGGSSRATISNIHLVSMIDSILKPPGTGRTQGANNLGPPIECSYCGAPMLRMFVGKETGFESTLGLVCSKCRSSNRDSLTD